MADWIGGHFHLDRGEKVTLKRLAIATQLAHRAVTTLGDPWQSQFLLFVGRRSLGATISDTCWPCLDAGIYRRGG